MTAVTPMCPQLTMNDFSVHRIIGRGGFGEVYGCRKADTGKMYAMKCLDKKRIKMKQGETLALNERIMLSLVSTGVSPGTRGRARCGGGSPRGQCAVMVFLVGAVSVL